MVAGGPTPLALPLPYPVYVGTGLLSIVAEIVGKNAPAHRVAVITDQTVSALHGATVTDSFASENVRLFDVPPGEAHKTRQQWAGLTDALFAWGAGRDTTVVALGGGVVGDLAGFVAATFMRGVPVVQVPTTLLAMVDAAVGGKTGVDTSYGKNLVGAFHDPSAVVMAIESLATLPPEVFRSGLAEMIKHGVIADEGYFQAMRGAMAGIGAAGANWPGLTALVADSVRIKASVVAQDRLEGGLRQTLNFGHTIAHAVEQLMDYTMLHGDAVGIGMVAEARIAEELHIAERGLSDSIVEALRLAGLPTDIPPQLQVTDILAATRGDKKNRGGATRYALPSSLGQMSRGDGSWSVPVEDAAVAAALSRGR
ncbi:MAG TPA: 3-dehydroquinate synthase [Gemmatimonas sp.]|nr:3-dehydroquinate synthase [Gemmatimonas sp.]